MHVFSRPALDPKRQRRRIAAVFGHALLPLVLAVAACGGPGSTTAPAAGEESSSDGATPGADPIADLPIVTERPNGHYAFINAVLPGGDPVVIEVRDGVIVDIPETAPEGLPAVDLEGLTIVPGFVDSHVHIAFQYGAEKVADGIERLNSGGLVGAVDLATPIEALTGYEANGFVAAGPMITAEQGYPTQSWGANGYGIEVSGPDAASDAVDAVADLGARLVKVPIDAGPALTDAELIAIIERAHERGLLVAAHALGEADAARAGELGADVLAHTPLEPLSDATVQLWSDRVVVSTLRAFGSRESAIDNVRRLHEAGATVLYGTDLGNLRVEGIDAGELLLLGQAGLSPAEILAAGTSAPARLWSMEGLGALEPGNAASLLVLDGDPLDDPTLLAEPALVFVDGVRVPPPPDVPGGFGP